MAEEKLVPVIIPSLIALLMRGEQEKGSPLTEQEVLAIRDKAPAVALPVEAIAHLAERRGYRDLDPANCWPEWQAARLELIEPRGDTGD